MRFGDRIGGKTTVQEIPADRFAAARWYDADPSAPGKIALRAAASQPGHQFDAEYFGIPPREVELMDPQQRLLLEVAMEAIDTPELPHAAWPAAIGRLRRRVTADYGGQLSRTWPPLKRGPASGLRLAPSPTASRMRSTYAAQASRSTPRARPRWSRSTSPARACDWASDVALAGGVNLVLPPAETLTLSEAGALRQTAEANRFDAAANGYGRGEGRQSSFSSACPTPAGRRPGARR